MPQLWIVAGPNGAGKTTLVSHRIARRVTIINPDVIAQELPRIDGRLDERQAGEIAISQRNALLESRRDFAIETTLTGSSALRLLSAAKRAGYKVSLVYVGLATAGLSMGRVLDRVRRGGHAVPLEALDRRYPASLANLARAIELADRSYVFDNSDKRRRLLLIYDRRRLKFQARDMPAWAATSLAHVLA